MCQGLFSVCPQSGFAFRAQHLGFVESIIADIFAEAALATPPVGALKLARIEQTVEHYTFTACRAKVALDLVLRIGCDLNSSVADQAVINLVRQG